MKIDKQGQKTVAATIRQPSLQSVVIKPDKTIMINGKQTDCSQKACELKQGEATVRKVQKADGKTQIQLSTKVRTPPYWLLYISFKAGLNLNFNEILKKG